MKNLILSFAMAFSMSCNKDKNCDLPTQIIGTGEIVSSGLVYQPLITWDMKNYEHIIRTDSQNVFNLKVSFDNGDNYDTVDFSQYTLLGKYARGNCKAIFERNATKNEMQKKIFYKVKVYQCGSCEINWESMNWVLVPKIPADYNVSFTIE